MNTARLYQLTALGLCCGGQRTWIYQGVNCLQGEFGTFLISIKNNELLLSVPELNGDLTLNFNGVSLLNVRIFVPAIRVNQHDQIQAALIQIAPLNSITKGAKNV